MVVYRWILESKKRRAKFVQLLGIETAKNNRNSNDDVCGASFLRIGGEPASKLTMEDVELRQISMSTAARDKLSIKCRPLSDTVTTLDTYGSC